VTTFETDAASDVVETLSLKKGMRGAVARGMHASLQTTAQLTLQRTAPVDTITALRSGEHPGKRPSVNDVVLYAVSRVLTRHPLVNATVEDDMITRWAPVHLGMAVALPDGLVVPVIHDAHRLSLAELGERALDLGERAKTGKVSMKEMSGGTFTVTNLGGLGIDLFTPILNPPQVAILGVGRVKDGEIGLSLTIDHRALDGAPGALFLAELAEVLGDPTAVEASP